MKKVSERFGTRIITIQPVFCTKPKEAAAILKDHAHRTLRESFFDVYMVKTQDAFTDLWERGRGHPARAEGNVCLCGNSFRRRWSWSPVPTGGGDQGKKQSQKEAETSFHLSIHH